MYPKLRIFNNNTPTFPLPKLPKPALKLVLLNFDSFQLLAYSLLSNKCKNQVVSLQKRAYYINVLMTRNVNIFIPPPDHKVFLWKNNDFRMADWLDHLHSVFHHQNLESINFLEESIEFNIDDLKGAFGRANKLITRRTDCEVFSQLILQKFLPIPELSIQQDIFQNSDFKIPLWILIQNFEKIEVGDESEVRPQVDLDDLLVMNSKKIDKCADRLSLKIINKFIKLWMRGSNSRMEHLRIWYNNNNDWNSTDIDMILRGITHKNLPIVKKRIWKLSPETEIYGGRDIHRIDGTKATILDEPSWNCSKFEMFVWYDHCSD